MLRTSILTAVSTWTLSATFLAASCASAAPCIIGPAGDQPPECTDGYVNVNGVLKIDNGLPVGTTIEINAQHNSFFNIVRAPGGNLGGEKQNFDSALELNLTGTGTLAGFNRVLFLLPTVETHTAPRNPGDNFQSFQTEMVSLDGQLFGDPDFDTLRVRAGSSLVGPSPGNTTLTRLPDTNFNVDSFFDITYDIEFQGAPGSILEGFGGISTGSVRLQAGDPVPEPSTSLLALLALVGTTFHRRRR